MKISAYAAAHVREKIKFVEGGALHAEDSLSRIGFILIKGQGETHETDTSVVG